LFRIANCPKILSLRAQGLKQSDAGSVDVLVFVNEHVLVGALQNRSDGRSLFEQSNRQGHQVPKVDAQCGTLHRFVSAVELSNLNDSLRRLLSFSVGFRSVAHGLRKLRVLLATHHFVFCSRDRR